MIEPSDFKRVLDFAYSAYQEHNQSGQELRQHGKVPFIVHPMWAAMMMLADQRLPFELREIGYQALLLHDVLEDTNAELPDWIDPEVARMVEDMTLPDDFKEVVAAIASKDIFTKLLILYDTLENVYEEHVTDWKRTMWKQGVEVLIREVEQEYGDLRVVHVGKAVLEHTNW